MREVEIMDVIRKITAIQDRQSKAIESLTELVERNSGRGQSLESLIF